MIGRLLGAAALGVAAASLVAAHRFVVTRWRLPLAGLSEPVRVVHLSDLHYGWIHGRGSVGRWVDAAMVEAPDLIVITGDFFDKETGIERMAGLTQGLRRLHAPLGVWGVIGNHDLHAARFGTRAALERSLERAGVRLMVNRGERVRPDLFLAGVDDLWLGRADLGAALDGAGEGATVLMSHNPDLLPRVPAWVGLTLSGHTHGGQVVLPLLGAMHTGSSYRQRFASGLVFGPARGIVSRGLGTTTLPVRLFCPPEVVVLDLVPA